MRHQERERLTTEIAELLRTNTVPMCETSMQNDTFRYQLGTYTQKELDVVFTQSPRVLGPSALVPDVGDFFTDEISGTPLLVTRDRDGRVRGFHNVCIHRGTKVVCEEQGRQHRFSCPFHGWVYDLSGKLRAVPSADAFPNYESTHQGLLPVNVLESHGLVWQLPESWGEEQLSQHLGGLTDELSSYDIDKFVLYRTEIIEQPMNWKFVIDGFLETYHFRFLHKNSIGPFVRSNFGLTDNYGLNTRMIVLRASYESQVFESATPDDLLEHAAVMYQLFPNTVLVWQGPHIEIWTVYPSNGAPDKCAIRVSVLIPDLASDEPNERDWERNWQILMSTVLDEDFAVSRNAQQAMKSGALTQLTYGRNEPALQAFHRNLIAEVERDQ